MSRPEGSPLRAGLRPYRYTWPTASVEADPSWRPSADGRTLTRPMPEDPDQVAADSRWPAFFPSPLCLVTAGDGARHALERVVGAAIVNRFPYVVALSFCRLPLSPRHHPRAAFMRELERTGSAAVQFLAPGAALDRALAAVAAVPEDRTADRVGSSRLAVRPGLTNPAPVFEAAHLVYEARLARPGKDFEGQAIYPTPWIDVGSHRLYFLEINAIQLHRDIADGRRKILWRSLPSWRPLTDRGFVPPADDDARRFSSFQKGYTPEYVFPSGGTVAFEADAVEHDMAVKHLPALPGDQVEVDNDRARWPCFFPSSAGMITCWAEGGKPNLMPCGSTTVVSRHPLVIAPCVSYAAINARYAPRASLNLLRRAGRFGCGVPYVHDAVVRAMRYAGNVSIAQDPDKVAHAGLDVEPEERAPVLPALPVHFDCEITGEVRLGTHVMFLGEARRLRVRTDVTPGNPLEWCPWADVGSSGG